jgi:hypothetical protein
MEKSVWLDEKGYLKSKSDSYSDTTLVVLCRGLGPKLFSIETFEECYAGAWVDFYSASEDLKRTGFVCLGEL